MKKIWKHKITCEDDNCVLFGVNIFDYDWIDTKEKITVIDPIYHKKCDISVYNVIIKGKIRKFAAGEFSNCIWGFYIERFSV